MPADTEVGGPTCHPPQKGDAIVKRVLAVLILGIGACMSTAGSSHAERKSPVEVIQAEYLSGDPTEPNGAQVRGPLESTPVTGRHGATRTSIGLFEDRAQGLSDRLLRGRPIYMIARVFGWILK